MKIIFSLGYGNTIELRAGKWFFLLNLQVLNIQLKAVFGDTKKAEED